MVGPSDLKYNLVLWNLRVVRVKYKLKNVRKKYRCMSDKETAKSSNFDGQYLNFFLMDRGMYMLEKKSIRY
jgi:hypothetical protein